MFGTILPAVYFTKILCDEDGEPIFADEEGEPSVEPKYQCSCLIAGWFGQGFIFMHDWIGDYEELDE